MQYWRLNLLLSKIAELVQGVFGWLITWYQICLIIIDDVVYFFYWWDILPEIAIDWRSEIIASPFIQLFIF